MQNKSKILKEILCITIKLQLIFFFFNQVGTLQCTSDSSNGKTLTSIIISSFIFIIALIESYMCIFSMIIIHSTCVFFSILCFLIPVQCRVYTFYQ